jgi:hypothetical protein
MDTEPACVTSEHLLDLTGRAPPIAIEQVRAKEILDFEVALPFEKPVAMRRDRFDGQCGAQHRLRHGLLLGSQQ